MKKPIIGIVGRVKDTDILIHEEYRTAIINAGGIPILLLPSYLENIDDILPFQNNINKNQEDMIEQMVNLCDGILFSGGSKWYGFDQYVYQYAYQQNKPILGICLGMQMIACAPYFNQTSSDQTRPVSSFINHQQTENYVHSINLTNSKLKSILGNSEIVVNSRHLFQIFPNNSFFISATSEDGVIEAIEIPSKKFIFGVQWHPESLYQFDPYSKRLFQAFIDICKIKKSC